MPDSIFNRPRGPDSDGMILLGRYYVNQIEALRTAGINVHIKMGYGSSSTYEVWVEHWIDDVCDIWCTQTRNETTDLDEIEFIIAMCGK